MNILRNIRLFTLVRSPMRMRETEMQDTMLWVLISLELFKK